VVENIVAAAIRDLTGAERVDFNVPPQPEYGDFSTAVALATARRSGEDPMTVAVGLQAALQQRHLPYVREVLVTPPGYLNFKIDYPALATSVIELTLVEGDAFGRPATAPGAKILVEHTNVNPNKAMHIGHVRNAITGDAVVRMLRRLGYAVEGCNYIDDTGVQVVEVVTAMLHLDPPHYDGANLQQMWAKADPGQPFDYWCWDLYARFQEALEQRPELAARKAEILHQVEALDNPVADFARQLASRVVQAHLAAVGRLGVYYNLLNWESDILRRGFWQLAFEQLRERGAVTYEESGPNAGCWVVPMGGVVETEEGVRSQDKILVRSNGTVTYTGKDVAYQMWKFGLLPVDFLYRLWARQGDGTELWTTAPDGQPLDRFGHADRVINVIDVRQSYPQQVVYQALAQVGYEQQARNSVHLAYEVVVLSPRAAEELGARLGQAGARRVAMSGRKGLGVKADDLFAAVVDRLRPKTRDQETAERLAAAAIRYFMLRQGLNAIIAFDFEEALQTTGDTGVYLEYAHARACSILEKAGEALDHAAPPPEALTATEAALVKKIAEFPQALARAGQELAPHALTRYAIELATAFSEFYETPDPGAAVQTPFIKLTDRALRAFRLALVGAFRQTMRNCCDALGLVPLDKI